MNRTAGRVAILLLALTLAWEHPHQARIERGEVNRDSVDHNVSPAGLLKAALVPTIIMFVLFVVLS